MYEYIIIIKHNYNETRIIISRKGFSPLLIGWIHDLVKEHYTKKFKLILFFFFLNI